MSTIKKYTDLRQYLRGLVRNAVHAGTGALITVFGTNGAEQLAPESLANIGLNWKQAVAVFAVSAAIAAVKFVHDTTEETTPPIPK